MDTCSIADQMDDTGYDDFSAELILRFTEETKTGSKLFQTDAEGVWEAFLTGFPEGAIRQHYNCHACRSFVEHYGGLVTIGEDGTAKSAMWGDWAVGLFAQPVAASLAVVAKSKVVGVFIGPASPWGTPVTGEWHHMHVIPPKALANPSRKLTPGQLIAEKKEEFGMLNHALADFPAPIVARAVALLEGDALYRSEKCLGVAKWFANLHAAIDGVKNRVKRDNYVWSAVASAPAGWCHVRSSMIGTLLEDLAAGLPFDDVARKFREKMHPLQYQRPSSAPSNGQIEAAEKLFEKLGLAKALERRYATLADIKTVWTPPALIESKKGGGGLFGHLKNSGNDELPDLDVAAKAITWEKFRATVLPTAERIDCLVPYRGDFAALVTAVHADAPMILQWDREDERNPASAYVYHGGSLATHWGLESGSWTPVMAITLTPSQWSESRAMSNHGKSAIFILKGAADSGDVGLALFPETLRSELHEVRSTIEAFSRRGKLAGREGASACGIQYAGNTFRVKSAGSPVAMKYKIDRWD